MSGDIKSDNSFIMRCETQSSIWMPAAAKLVDDEITWQARFQGKTGTIDGFEQRPTKDCLHDFVRLSEGTADDVLEFVKMHGVLGLKPFVKRKNDFSRGWVDWETTYREPISLYQQLASQASAILKTARVLKSGNPVQPEEIAKCYSSGESDYQYNRQNMPDNNHIYQRLLYVLYFWGAMSDFKIGLDAGASWDNPPRIGIRFGKWQHGAIWDQEREKQRRGEDRLSFVIDEEDLVDEWFLNIHVNGLPYREIIDSEIRHLPDMKQRPSPLFNVLTFQMFQDVILPEGTYFCSQCNRPIIYDPDQAKKIGMSKPRKDRPTAFCSTLCRQDYDAADNRRRYHEKKTISAGGN